MLLLIIFLSFLRAGLDLNSCLNWVKNEEKNSQSVVNQACPTTAEMASADTLYWVSKSN